MSYQIERPGITGFTWNQWGSLGITLSSDCSRVTKKFLPIKGREGGNGRHRLDLGPITSKTMVVIYLYDEQDDDQGQVEGDLHEERDDDQGQFEGVQQ